MRGRADPFGGARGGGGTSTQRKWRQRLWILGVVLVLLFVFTVYHIVSLGASSALTPNIAHGSLVEGGGILSSPPANIDLSGVTKEPMAEVKAHPHKGEKEQLDDAREGGQRTGGGNPPADGDHPQDEHSGTTGDSTEAPREDHFSGGAADAEAKDRAAQAEKLLGRMHSRLRFEDHIWKWGAQLLMTQSPVEDTPRGMPDLEPLGPDACSLPYGYDATNNKGFTFPMAAGEALSMSSSSVAGLNKGGGNANGAQVAEAQDLEHRSKVRDRTLKMKVPIKITATPEIARMIPDKIMQAKHCVQEMVRLLQWEYGLVEGEHIFYDSKTMELFEIWKNEFRAGEIQSPDDRAYSDEEYTHFLFTLGPNTDKDSDDLEAAELPKEAEREEKASFTEVFGLSVAEDAPNHIRVVARTPPGVYRAMTSLKYLMDGSLRLCPSALKRALHAEGNDAAARGEDDGLDPEEAKQRRDAELNRRENDGNGQDGDNPHRDHHHDGPTEDPNEKAARAEGAYILLHGYPMTFDWPAASWRGLMLDAARHYVPLDKIKLMIQHLSLLKMNVLHLHLSDDQGWRLALDQFPQLSEVGARRGPNLNPGAGGERVPGQDKTRFFGSQSYEQPALYTKEEIREISEFASAHHVTIVPEIDIPAHTAALIASLSSHKNKIDLFGKRQEPANRAGGYHDPNAKEDLVDGEGGGVEQQEEILIEEQGDGGPFTIDGILHIGEGCDKAFKEVVAKQIQDGKEAKRKGHQLEEYGLRKDPNQLQTALNCMGGTHGILLPSEKTMATIREVISAVINDVFVDSHYIHLGGDEAAELRDAVWGLHYDEEKNGRLKDLPEEEKPISSAIKRYNIDDSDGKSTTVLAEINRRMIHDVVSMVGEMGRTPTVWGESFSPDMMEEGKKNDEGMMDSLSPVSMWWRDWHPDGRWSKVKEQYKRKPHNMVLAPSSNTYLDTYQKEPHDENRFAVQAGTVTTRDAFKVGELLGELVRLNEAQDLERDLKEKDLRHEDEEKAGDGDAELGRKKLLEKHRNENEMNFRRMDNADPNEDIGDHFDPNSLQTPLLGVEACLWTETITDWKIAEYQMFPRLLAIASAAWRGEGTKSTQFSDDNSMHFGKAPVACEQVLGLFHVYGRMGLEIDRKFKEDICS